jgi:hypothetical protein
MNLILGCILFVAAALTGGETPLKTRLEKAKPGDYVVTELQKTTTLLCIRSVTPYSLILEEISAPTESLKKNFTSWPEWVKAKAPGHSSWSMIEIDPKTGQILECYSFSKSSWVTLSPKESLVATLLNLPMKPISADKRKKIGPAPLADEPDVRKIWNPPLVIDGLKVENASFEVFETTWPNDGSELSKKDVILYFDQEKKSPLPTWVQVETSHLVGNVKAIDSGRGLPVIHRNLPRRVPEFVGIPIKTEKGVTLRLKSPKYYREFELFAIDITTKEKQICPVAHNLIQGQDEWLTLEVDTEALEASLQENHRYTWLLVPIGHNESYTQHFKPFVWSP